MEQMEELEEVRRRRPRVWRAGGALVCAALIAGMGPQVAGAASQRGYEQVSPVDKNAGDVLVEPVGLPPSFYVDSSPSGEAVSFLSGTPFAGSPVGAYNISYVARRSGDGWSTVPVAAPNHGGFAGQASVAGYSESLTRAITLASDPLLAPDAAPGTLNYFVSDVGQLNYTTVSAGTQPGFLGYPDVSYVGSSADASHIVFRDANSHTPTAPAGVVNMYEWTAGGVRLVNVLPDGTPAASGADGGGGSAGSMLNAVSADGSKIFFTTPDNGQLYVRLNGTSTQAVSRSHKLVPDASLPATFWTASRDGGQVIFSSDEQLIDADQDATTDLYRYSVADDSLELLTKGAVGNLMTVYGVIGASDAGDSIYFVGSVDDGATGGIYLWRNGVIEEVAPTFGSYGTMAGQNQTARVSADGTGLVFTSENVLTGYDPQGTTQVYVYDADRKILSCASCPRDGKDAVGSTLLPPGTKGSARFGNPSTYQASISDDGSRVFFSTPQRLVTGDSNSRFDAYEFSDGEVRLISSGQSDDNSYFQDASSDGRDAFFTTREQLASTDRDNNIDLYNATLDDVAEPSLPEPECVGSGCQPSSASAGEVPRLGSSTLATGENAPDPKAAPSFTVKKIAGADWRRFAATGRLRLTMTASERGTFTAELLAQRGTTTLVADRRSAALTKRGTATIVLRASKAAKSVIARRGATRVRAVVRFSKAAAPVTLRYVVRKKAGAKAIKTANRKAER